MAGSYLKSAPLWFLVTLWYCSAALAVTSSRHILKETQLPFTLSACQYMISTIISYIILKYLLPYLTNNQYKSLIRDYSYDKPEGKLIRSIALTYTLGFVLTNISLSLCNASFSETIKSAEPISSLTLATLTRGEDAVSNIEWLTTLPIVIGVGLSSYSDTSFNFIGFISASLSNFMFSMRGINTKQLRRLHGTPHGLDDIHLFYYISKFGAKLVIPIALLLEGIPLYRILTNIVIETPMTILPELISIETSKKTFTEVVGESIINTTSRILSETGTQNLLNHDIVSNSMIDSNSNSSGGGDVLHDVVGSLDASSAAVMPEVPHIHSIFNIFLLVLLNGFCYSIYNQTSFVVLSRVSFVNHATFNVMRRVFIIIFTSWWFNIHISLLNSLGILMALGGFALFLYLKVKAPATNSTLPIVA